ncbi:predicted protein [Naegleria gruberi]|uniref:Predicted protein n=1 Tax=Naegleria gruberi TaxID=5762 RepID=D2VGK5_NAEGR|nr:uncharacterized protein NAEGRDRAFT_68011 [Naegleria gruberi]EFC44081.1 predicted protein [Naegleria gruberi]|eukprot:XP_002676825.1 predicted protein [Naegleria gruberi strain NEG-M]
MSPHYGQVVIVLDSTPINKLSTNFINLNHTMNKTREECLQKLNEYWKYLVAIHGPKMMKRKFVFELYNSIPTKEIKKQFLLEYLVKDYHFPFIHSFMEDEDFMLQAIRKKKEMLLFHCGLWKKKSFALNVVKYSKDALKKVECIDLDIISSALESKPKSLQFCKTDIRNDKGMVLKSLGKTYGNIIFIGETLLDDVDILRKCLSKSNTFKSLKNTLSVIEMMKEIVKRYPLSMLRFYKWLKDEIEFEIKEYDTIMINGKLYKYRIEMLRYVEDVQMARKFIRFSGKNYDYFNEIVREDVETFKLAMSTDCQNVVNIPETIGQNKELINWLYENDCSNRIIDHIISNRPNDDELTNHLLKKYVSDVLEKKRPFDIPHYLHNHKNLFRKAIKIQFCYFHLVDNFLRK